MSASRSTGVRAALAVYRYLALALPSDLRERHGHELVADAERALQGARRRGRMHLARAATGALWDLEKAVAREWLRSAFGRNQSKGAAQAGPGRVERMGAMLRELGLAVRTLLRRPGYTAVAVGTLAVGMGAVLAIFTVVNAVVLQPLPFPDSDRIVTLRHHAPGVDLPELNISPGLMNFYGENLEAVSSLAAFTEGQANLTGPDEPARVDVLLGTPNLMDVLQVRTRVGRRLVPADADEGAAPVALLTHAGWVSRFGSDPSILGRTVELNGDPVEIVGILPEDVAFPDDETVAWMPMSIDPDGAFGAFGISGVARLAPGVTMAAARQQLQDLQPRVPEYFPDLTAEFLEGLGWGASLITLHAWVVDDVAATLWIVLGTVAFVLLIACANVANLFLVRAEDRRKEMAVRAALGAGRRAIAGTFLSESFVLGGVGALLGIALAWVGVDALVATIPSGVPRVHEIGLDGTVVGLAAALAVGVGLLLGILPVGRMAGIARGLTGVSRSATQGRERHRARDLLVTVQLALALVLLVGSGLMLRSFEAMRSVDPGIDPEGVLVMGLSLGEGVDPTEAAAFYQRVAAEVAALPGVTSTGVTNAVPMASGSTNGGSYYIESQPREEGAIPPVAFYKAASPGVVESLGIPLVQGRSQTWADVDDARPVAWVNEAFARETFEGDPIGERIRWDEDEEWAEIVGVIGDVREFGVDEELRPMAYINLVMADWGYPELDRVFIVAKTPGDPAALAGPIRSVVRRLGPSVPVLSARTMDEIVSESMEGTSYTMILLGITSVVALLLGAVGLFGVISYVVAQRTREIGIRVAMGAERGDVEFLFVRQALGVIGLGVLLGLVGAFALTRAMGAILFETSATDPMTFLLAPVVLVAVALLATWVPARRAAGVDPLEALAAE